MTSAVVSILNSIDRLSVDEQQEIVLKLLEKMVREDRIESMGLATRFHRLKKAKAIVLSMNSERSFFEVAGDLIGAGEGPGDLSTNADYLKGYGE